VNAFLGIEVHSAQCFFETHDKMKSDSVALSIHNTAIELQKEKFEKAIFYIDQNPTHKNLMQYNLALLSNREIEIEIKYIPSYSPNLNIVEFLIHLIRQKKLHHAPHERNLDQIVVELTDYLQLQFPFEKATIYNILNHIMKNMQNVNVST
jgi:DDE superfamily endonuclease